MKYMFVIGLLMAGIAVEITQGMERLGQSEQEKLEKEKVALINAQDQFIRKAMELSSAVSVLLSLIKDWSTESEDISEIITFQQEIEPILNMIDFDTTYGALSTKIKNNLRARSPWTISGKSIFLEDKDDIQALTQKIETYLNTVQQIIKDRIKKPLEREKLEKRPIQLNTRAKYKEMTEQESPRELGAGREYSDVMNFESKKKPEPLQYENSLSTDGEEEENRQQIGKMNYRPERQEGYEAPDIVNPEEGCMNCMVNWLRGR